jgi:AcrR family transcriptional regulator
MLSAFPFHMVYMTRKNPERPQELLAAAQALFFSKGYESTSISDIIHAVGVSKGAFYHHFESKAAVLEAVVAQMVDEAVANLHEVASDPSLSAIPKWQKAVHLSNRWKMERKGEVIEANRLVMLDENLLLKERIRSRANQAIAREMSAIIAQGVNEGVFDVQHIAETAAILVAVIGSLNDSLRGLVSAPDQQDNPVTAAVHMRDAVQIAVERLLNAPPGTLPMIDNESLLEWVRHEESSGLGGDQ